ncbi:MAG: ferredoxin--NADP reductase [Maricaulaceae bacterium]|nr:ferredoxin--NADP reductase [Maricaulaceae bacterium]
MQDSPAASQPATASARPSPFFVERVLEVTHWTDRLFSFRITRPASFRFRSGEFAMLGLMADGKPLLRAYSMASPFWEETLEFFSIKVPDGPLTSRLQNIRPGDEILMGKKPTGTLVLDALTPARRLYMFSTGTGIAPFASLIRDPETYEMFEQVILTHTCRLKAELAYGHDIVARAKADPLVGAEASARLIHYASTTREQSPHMGRITAMVDEGRLFAELGLPELSSDSDRVMICGSEAMLKDIKSRVEARGFIEGSNAAPGQFVIEKAFVS